MGCDKRNGVVTLDKDLFQFTHPAWGATFVGYSRLDKIEPFQFTHPAWGATVGGFLQAEYLAVSIHAPRVGCDVIRRAVCPAVLTEFQFTHPAWGATGNKRDWAAGIRTGFNSRTPRGVRLAEVEQGFGLLDVSIHAPRVGCDVVEYAVRTH